MLHSESEINLLKECILYSLTQEALNMCYKSQTFKSFRDEGYTWFQKDKLT